MICVDFLAGANLQSGGPHVLLHSILRLFNLPSGQRKKIFLDHANERPHELSSTKACPLRLDSKLWNRFAIICAGTAESQSCGRMSNLEVHHRSLAANREQFRREFDHPLHEMHARIHNGVEASATRGSIDAARSALRLIR